MRIRITYCQQWNYLPRATSLAAAIQDARQVQAELIAGSGGIFDVRVNGKLIFSKHEAGRFPENDEVLDLLKPGPK